MTESAWLLSGDEPLNHNTGVAAIDDVLESVRGLDALAPEDHVAVFEQAHEVLRHALDDPSLLD